MPLEHCELRPPEPKQKRRRLVVRGFVLLGGESSREVVACLLEGLGGECLLAREERVADELLGPENGFGCRKMVCQLCRMLVCRSPI